MFWQILLVLWRSPFSSGLTGSPGARGFLAWKLIKEANPEGTLCMELTLYHYKATVESVYDGDTVHVNIDLGLKTWIMDEVIRLYGINAPELRGDERPKGLASRDRLKELIERKDIYLETIKDTKGKYGRYLGKIWIEENGKWISINDRLVEEGFAEYKDY